METRARTRQNRTARGSDRIDVRAGQNLKGARLRAGLSQEKLARAVGIHYQQLQKYESGKTRISLARACQFSKILGVPLDHFVSRPDVASTELLAASTPGRQREGLPRPRSGMPT